MGRGRGAPANRGSGDGTGKKPHPVSPCSDHRVTFSSCPQLTSLLSPGRAEGRLPGDQQLVLPEPWAHGTQEDLGASPAPTPDEGELVPPGGRVGGIPGPGLPPSFHRLFTWRGKGMAPQGHSHLLCLCPVAPADGRDGVSLAAEDGRPGE